MSRAVASDEALWRAYRAKADEAAFDELVRRHWPQAFRLASTCLSDPSAAEDVAQEVFVRVARADATFESKGDFVAWLRTLIYNAVRMHVRSRDRRRQRETQVAARRPQVAEPQGERQAQAAEVREHVAQLPVELGFAIALRYFEGCGHKDVAEAIGCPQGTASSRIRLGLERLRDSLASVGVAVTAPGLEEFLRQAPTFDIPAAPSLELLLAKGAVKAGVAAKALAFALALMLALAGGWAIAGPDADPPPPALAAAGGLGDEPADEPDGEADPVLGEAPSEAGSAEKPGPGFAGADPAPSPQGADAKTTPRPRVPDPSPEPRVGVTMRGRVLHADTGMALAGVEVYVFSQSREGTYSSSGKPGVSDAAGHFSVALQGDPLSRVGLLTRQAGFRPSVRGVSPEAAEQPLELQVSPGESAQLTGRVLRPDGTPAGGIKPYLTLRFEAREVGLLNGEPAPEQPFEGTLGVELEADAEGRFTLAGIPAGDARVMVREAWLGFLDASAEGRAAADPAEIVIQLVHGGRLVVEVRDRAGATLPDAAVEVQLNDGQTRGKRTVSDANGLATFTGLEFGDYQLRVVFPVGTVQRERRLSALRLLSTPDHAAQVTVATDHEQRLVVQQAEQKRGALTVEVRDAAGAPRAGVKVWLNLASPAWDDALEAISDAEGRVVFPSLPYGRYGLQTAQRPVSEPEATVEIDGAQEAVRLVAVPLHAIEGVVVDGSGRPVPAAEIALFPLEGGIGLPVATDEAGRFRVAAYPLGFASVHVEAAGFVSLATTRRNDGRPWRLVLTPAQSLVAEGRVDAPDGTPVRLHLWVGTASFGAVGKVVAGRFAASIENLERGVAGELWVRVGESVPVQVPIVAGQTEVDLGELTLRAGRSVRGRLMPPASWLGAFSGEVSGEPSTFYELEVDRDGRFEIKGLADEPFDLHACLWSSGPEPEFRAATVRVDPVGAPDLGEIELQVQEVYVPEDLACLQVTISDPAGLIATLGFQEGDLIVGLNGTAFTDSVQLEQLLQSTFGQAPNFKTAAVTFNVRRGDEEVEVVDPTGQIMSASPERLGGMLAPNW